MTSGKKINDFLTARKKIYAQEEKNQCFLDKQEKIYDQQEKNLCPAGRK